MPKIITPFAQNGDKTAVPVNNDPNNYVSFNQGYTGDYQLEIGQAASAKPVERTKMNYLFNTVTTEIKTFQELGHSLWWNPATTTGFSGYYKGALVFFQPGGAGTDYVAYRATTGTSVAPNTASPTDTNNWEPVYTNSEIRAIVPMNESGLANGSNIDQLNAGVFELTTAPTLGSLPPSPAPGMIEVKIWSNGGTGCQAVQRYTYATSSQQYIRGGTGSSMAPSSIAWSTWLPTGFTPQTTLSGYNINDAVSSRKSGGNLCPDANFVDVQSGAAPVPNSRTWNFERGGTTGSQGSWSIARGTQIGDTVAWVGNIASGVTPIPQFFTSTPSLVTCEGNNIYDKSCVAYAPANGAGGSISVGVNFYDGNGAFMSTTIAQTVQFSVTSTAFRQQIGGRVFAPAGAKYMGFTVTMPAPISSAGGSIYFSAPAITPIIGKASKDSARDNFGDYAVNVDTDSRAKMTGEFYFTTACTGTLPPNAQAGVIKVTRLSATLIAQEIQQLDGYRWTRFTSDGSTWSTWARSAKQADVPLTNYQVQTTGVDFNGNFNSAFLNNNILFNSDAAVNDSTNTPYKQFNALPPEAGWLEVTTTGGVIIQRFTGWQSRNVFVRSFSGSTWTLWTNQANTIWQAAPTSGQLLQVRAGFDNRVVSTNNRVVTFPTAFPNACIAVVATEAQVSVSGGSNVWSMDIRNYDQNGFTAVVTTNGGGFTWNGLHYIAYGY